jgi:hypothetical protein
MTEVKLIQLKVLAHELLMRNVFYPNLKGARNSSSLIFMRVAKGSFFLQASKFKTYRSPRRIR